MSQNGDFPEVEGQDSNKTLKIVTVLVSYGNCEPQKREGNMTTLSAITFAILIGATVGALVTVLAAAIISGRVSQEEEESEFRIDGNQTGGRNDAR